MEICEKNQKNKSALLLQGGGARGAFTAGVIDVFLENNIEFSAVYGVSAGTLNGQNLVSKQQGRAKWAVTELLRDEKFCSMNNLKKKHSLFDFDYYFAEGEKPFPFDDKVFYSNKTKFYACATNCLTGEGIYFEKDSCKHMIKAIEASASMPLVSRPVFVGETPCLDGAISVVIPYRQAKIDGYEKNVIITTRDLSFRKGKMLRKQVFLGKWMYRKYKNFIKAFVNQNEFYNGVMDEIDNDEKGGKNFVIRPQKPINLPQIVTDVNVLLDLYEHGRQVALENLDKLRKYLDE